MTQARHDKHNHSALQWIESINRSEQKELLILTVVFGSIYLVTLLIGISNTAHALWMSIPSGMLACWFAILYFSRRKVENHSVYRIIRSNPESIVWIYPDITELMPFGIKLWSRAYIVFKFIDKKEVTIKVKQSWVPGFMDALRMSLPFATFGYSADKKQWYQADPHLLLKERSD